MRRRCHTCLCRTCITVCGKCTKCKEKTTYCEGYNRYEQMSIFNIPQEQQYQGTPRHSIYYYGLTDERVAELERLIQSGRYASLVSQAAHRANETIAEYILLSVKENKSYDVLEKLWARGEIERIPYGKTDFYGIRRYFFSIFNEKMKEIGK